ncbi:MAG TPA: glycosyltransferase, partial [Armatimonadota bacterium]|nr:glycosyltransferase [Armatimonadota bacterium]
PPAQPRFLERHAYRWLLGQIDRGIAVTNAIREAVEATTPGRESPWTVIHNGIDSQRFERRIDPGVKRKEIGVNPSAAVVGVVARLAKEKGVDVFLHAAAEVAKEIPNVDFVIVGDGPERDSLELLAHELGLSGQTVFLGQRRDVHQILSAIDVLSVPSREDSFGLVALEGLAAGTSIIVSDVPGLREVLGDAGVATFVPPDEPKPLAAALRDELNRVSIGDEIGDDQVIPLAGGDMATLAEALVSETEFNLDRTGLARVAQPQEDAEAEPEITDREELLRRFDIRTMVDATVALYEDLAASLEDPTPPNEELETDG